MNLTERFKKSDGSGRGEIEAAFFGNLGDSDDETGMRREEFFGNARGFGAEDEPVAVGEGRLPERAIALAGEEPDLAGDLLRKFKESGGVVVNGEAQSGPVVHGAAAEISVAEDEAEGADEVEFGSAGDAGAGDVAGVGGNLRLEERDLEAVRAKLGEIRRQ